MRRINSPPYCFLETVKPVRHKTWNKNFKQVSVFRRYRFEGWEVAKDLPELIEKYRHKIESYGWKCDPRKGTVNGLPVRRVESDTYQDERFTVAELKAPPGYGYWKCDPKAKTVTLLCMFDFDMDRYRKNRKLWKKITSDPRYLPPLTVPMPDGWVLTHSKQIDRDKKITLIPQLSSFLDGRPPTPPLTFEQAFEKLAGFLDKTVNWRVEAAVGWPTNVEELRPLVFTIKPPRAAKGRKYWQITGKTFANADSPKVLYRAMHYFGKTKLTELYKGHLVRVHHPKGDAFADIGTWKCEMEIRLYADAAQSETVQTSAEIRAWYDLLIKMLETKTSIYSGNNFVV